MGIKRCDLFRFSFQVDRVLYKLMPAVFSPNKQTVRDLFHFQERLLSKEALNRYLLWCEFNLCGLCGFAGASQAKQHSGRLEERRSKDVNISRLPLTLLQIDPSLQNKNIFDQQTEGVLGLTRCNFHIGHIGQQKEKRVHGLDWVVS